MAEWKKDPKVKDGYALTVPKKYLLSVFPDNGSWDYEYGVWKDDKWKRRGGGHEATFEEAKAAAEEMRMRDG